MHFLFSISLLLLSSITFCRTIVVGKKLPVKSLITAIAMAKDRDTILLQPGIYKEGNIVLTKSISIVGINYPVLDGEGKYEILTISGNNIVIKGIQFQNAGRSSMEDYASIKVINSSDVTIEGNKIINSYFGIHFSNSTAFTIRSNYILGSPTTEQNTGNGIHLWKCDRAVIANNQIQGHRDGIYFEFVTNSTIENNYSHNNIRYGLHFMFSNDDRYVKNTFQKNGAGVAVMFSHHVNMIGNTFEENWGSSAYGILLKEISDGEIRHNRFYKNTVGIHLEGTNRIQVHENIFKENGWAVKVQASCTDNNFHHNNSFGNSFDIATNGSLVLNKFYNNYWDKYEGYDIKKDGIGDVPYHPVSMYSMIVEQNPNSLILLKSFMVSLLDKAEKAIPSLTPENLVDDKPMMKPIKL